MKQTLPVISSIAFLLSCASSPPPAAPAIASQPAPPPVAASSEVAETPPPACRGESLELLSLALSHQCDVGGTAADLPAAVEVSLASDAAEATSGDEVTSALVLTNRGAAAAALRLDASCSFANLVDVSVYSGHGVRLDVVGTDRCAEPSGGCAGHVIAVSLAPGGVARIPFSFPARVALADTRTCEAHAGRALAPGRYRTSVKTPLAPAPLAMALRVEAVRRLPVSRCASYARELAELAEPDLTLRDQVAARVADQCRRQPPRRALVDCQLSSRSETELAACDKDRR